MTYKKYYLYKKQVSYDGGVTYQDVVPLVTAPSGDPIASYSTLAECEGSLKFTLTYNDGTTYTAACDSTTAITSGETRIEGYGLSAITDVVVGSCVKEVGFRAFSDGMWISEHDSSGGNLPCPNTAYTYTYTGTTNITSITISEGVESLGLYSFSCAQISAITIPNTITTIDGYAFAGCSALTSVNIPSSVTTLGQGAFKNCYSLTSATIPSSVTILGNLASRNGGTFQNCTSLSSVTIPNSVTTIGQCAFKGSSLTAITIPSSVTTIGEQAFKACNNLTSISVPSSVTTIYKGAFYNSCLDSVTIEATSPPTITSSSVSENVFSTNTTIYVPCASVDTYKAATGWSNYASQIEGIPPCEPPAPTCNCDSFAFSGTEEVETNFVTVKVKNNTGNAIYVNHVELYYANGEYDDEHDFGSIECDGSSATTTLTDQFDVMAGLPQTVTGATIDVCHEPQCSNPGSETVTFNPDTLTNEGDIITLTFNG